MKSLFLTTAVLIALKLLAADAPVIDPLDTPTFTLAKEKGAIELVDGHAAKALKFSFQKDCRSAFATSKIKGAPEWDNAAGFSFWVKGDGSDHLGGIEIVYDNDFSVRYGYAFPIDSTEWKQIVVPWKDLIPETCNDKAKPLVTANAPSKISGFWFGKWWYWRDYAAHSYTIDDIRLEPKMSVPAEVKPPQKPLAHLVEKITNGRPIIVVTMGDSLTDFQHAANKPVNWPTLLKEGLQKKYGGEVTLVNPAMGGTELRQNVVLIPRWIKQAPEPDLVTIWFGGNDWNSGMRGEMFKQSMNDAIERVRRATNGKAGVLVLTTCPAVEKWDTVAELAEAARAAAMQQNAALTDIYAVFHESGKTQPERLFFKDKVHLGPAGHELVAKTLLDLIAHEAGK